MDEKTELLKRVGICSLLSLVALCGRVVDNAVLFLTSSALTEYKIFFRASNESRRDDSWVVDVSGYKFQSAAVNVSGQTTKIAVRSVTMET